jgi:hypothetical protein
MAEGAGFRGAEEGPALRARQSAGLPILLMRGPAATRQGADRPASQWRVGSSMQAEYRSRDGGWGVDVAVQLTS